MPRIGKKIKLNRETLRNLQAKGDLRDLPGGSYPDSSPETVCCTASCRHIC